MDARVLHGDGCGMMACPGRQGIKAGDWQKGSMTGSPLPCMQSPSRRVADVTGEALSGRP
jgi:hypothetical protein